MESVLPATTPGEDERQADALLKMQAWSGRSAECIKIAERLTAVLECMRAFAGEAAPWEGAA